MMTATLKIVVAALALLGTDAPRLDARQVHCLAEAVYHEARGEVEVGQLAVAHVVLTRAKARAKSPASICAVIRKPGQFSWSKAHPPIPDQAAWGRAVRVALIAALDPFSNPLPESTHFYAPAVEHPDWADVFVEARVIGGHRFMFKDG